MADSLSSVVASANALLQSLSISTKPIANFNELEANSSSMFVAIFEKLFACRIRNVRRRPETGNDREYNANLVVNALKPRVMDPNVLDGVTGRALCGLEGPAVSVAAIATLVDIFTSELRGGYCSWDSSCLFASGVSNMKARCPRYHTATNAPAFRSPHVAVLHLTLSDVLPCSLLSLTSATTP